MIVFPEETEEEVYLDVYLSDSDIHRLRMGKMINSEILDWMRQGKKIYIGLINSRHGVTKNEEIDEDEELEG